MKKLGRILSLVLVILVLTMAFAFADNEPLLTIASDVENPAGFSVVKLYPENDATGVALENFGVKLEFDTEFTDEIVSEINKDMFKLVGPYKVEKEVVEDYEFELKVLYSEEEPNKILVLIDKTEDGKTVSLESNSPYVFTILAGLTSDNGTTLGNDYVLNFQTLNQNRNNTVNTVLMFGMMGILIFITTRSARKQQEKSTTEKAKKDPNFDPYKEAKKTGKSVQQVILEHEKEMAKKAKKVKKEENKVDYNEKEIWLAPGQYYVTTKRAISPERSKYVAKYKEEQAKKREEIKRQKELAKQAKKAKKK